MAFIHQELAQVPGRHVSWDLHHFNHAILTEDLHNLGGNIVRAQWDLQELDTCKCQPFMFKRKGSI